MFSKFKNNMKNWWFKHNYFVKDLLFCILVGHSFIISTCLTNICFYVGMLGFLISYILLEKYVLKSIKWRDRNGKIRS